jgi:hypothetical protein
MLQSKKYVMHATYILKNEIPTIINEFCLRVNTFTRRYTKVYKMNKKSHDSSYIIKNEISDILYGFRLRVNTFTRRHTKVSNVQKKVMILAAHIIKNEIPDILYMGFASG